MIYKGYKGSIEYNHEDKCYYGKILHIRDLVLFEGKTLLELEKFFICAVDEYIKEKENENNTSTRKI